MNLVHIKSRSFENRALEQRQKGLTLVELLVVIAILAVLATVSVVGYSSFIERAAISNDERTVTQLNYFKNAYAVNKNEALEKNDIKNILQDSEVGELRPQSEKYGYGFYFIMGIDKFALLKIDEVDAEDEDYIKLPEGLAGLEDDKEDITPPDNEDEETPELPDIPEPKPEPEPDTEPEQKPDDEIDISKYVIHYNSDKVPSKNKPYFYTVNGEVYAAINFGEENKGVKIDTSKIIFNDGEKDYLVSSIRINGFEGDTITSTGYNKLEFALTDSDIIITKEIVVQNLVKGYNPTDISFSDEPNHGCEIDENGDLKISVLYDASITVYNADTGLSDSFSSSQINQDKELLKYISIKILFDNSETAINVLEHGIPSYDGAFYSINENNKINYYVAIKNIGEMPASYTVIYEIGFDSEFSHREIVTVDVK